MGMHIILASKSPRRQELLRRVGLENFTVLVPEADESCPAGLSPEETVRFISRKKALAAKALAPADALIIAADTMVFFGDKRLGKPKDEQDALRMLLALQGQKHKVCTGVTVLRGETVLTEAEATDVFFRPASEEELLRYIRGGEPMDKAGAYGVQGKGSLLVRRIEGDYYNVMGLPLLRLSAMLERFGVTLL